MRRSLIAAAFVLAGMAGVPAQAQTPVTQQQVLAACTTTSATNSGCQAVIASYFAYLQAAGITGGALEQAIADLVVALAETPAPTVEIQAVVAAGLQTIGTTYASGEQAAAILQVAAAVAAGETIPPDSVVIPVSSSPA